ncbi:amidohydrolase family protein [Curvibacter sp. APW13]|uniref:amidohydrolase family protein n=1 Tax=Curvibacter sp. APW13 TaxID=3077236 RepID=UPI0028DF5D47|nr:amidohydrolase family protein [Curvibacter sp. APW13]MDT8989737.1 amidohydrolase family protein [Curvibacter sp. APW13]
MRKTLLGLTFLVGQACWAQTAAYPVTTEPSDPSRPARALEKGNGYKAGLTDVLLHIDPSFDGDRVPKILGDEKVRHAVIMPVPNEGTGNRNDAGTIQKIALAQAQPKQVKVMCAGDYLSNWLADAMRYGLVESAVQQKFARLEADLDSGRCLGVGEFGLFHFNKKGDQNIIQNRYDHPLVLRMVDAIGTRGAWIQLHAEPREPNGRSHEKELWDTLQNWTQRQPKLRIVLSHTGMTSATNARRILETFPNVYLSIKLMSTKVSSWTHLEPLLNEDGALFEDWAQLMEAMPERFMVGTDSKFGQSGHEGVGEEAYDKTVHRYRRMLGSLAPEAAKRIAAQNANRLFGFKGTPQESDPAD